MKAAEYQWIPRSEIMIERLSNIPTYCDNSSCYLVIITSISIAISNSNIPVDQRKSPCAYLNSPAAFWFSTLFLKICNDVD